MRIYIILYIVMLPSCADSDRSCPKEIFDLPKSEFQGDPPIRKRTCFFLRGSTKHIYIYILDHIVTTANNDYSC